jgi:hypothetical protein
MLQQSLEDATSVLGVQPTLAAAAAEVSLQVKKQQLLLPALHHPLNQQGALSLT